MSPAFVVRSLRPGVTIPAVRKADKARKKARKAVLAWVDENYPGMAASTYEHFDGSFHATGLFAIEGSTSSLPIPEGMRYDKSLRAFVPAKRTDEGKAIARQMAEFTFTYPRIDGLGGIVTVADQSSHYFTGWKFRVLDGHVFAALSKPILKDRPSLAVIEAGDRWVEVALSEFHIAQEAAA